MRSTTWKCSPIIITSRNTRIWIRGISAGIWKSHLMKIPRFRADPFLGQFSGSLCGGRCGLYRRCGAGLYKRTGAMYVFLYGTCLSILIEGMQYVLNLGFFEWDDIISNVVGTIIGYYIVFILTCVFEGKRRKKNLRL